MPLTLPQRPVAITIIGVSSAVTWTDMPAALTEVLGVARSRTKFDLSLFTQARLTVRTSGAGAAGAELRAQYSTDESAWAYLDGSAGPAASLAAANATATAGWVDIATAAKTDVVLRVAGIGGDATADPSFGLVVLELR